MKETYRFWSLDPLYIGICKRVIEKGVSVRELLKDSVNRDAYLFRGVVYTLGKEEDRPFPAGSHPRHPPVSNPFPATLEIITETVTRLGKLEKEWGIGEDIPRNSQRKLAPSEKWDARPIPEKKK